MIEIYKGVIFDLDGTILDSMEVWERVDEIFLAENGIVNHSNISDIVKKMSIEESAQFFIDEFKLLHTNDYVIKRIEEIVCEQYAKNIELKPYAEQFLDWLDEKNIPYCVATATYKTLAESALKRLGVIDRFKFVLTCSDVGEGKTSPKVYLCATEKLGLLPSETAVFEDALHCMETAKKAGFYVMGMYDKISADDWNDITKICDRTVMSFKELIDN